MGNIVARRFSVIDEEGRERIVIEVDRGFPVMRFLTKGGSTGMRLAQTGGGFALSLYEDTSGKKQVELTNALLGYAGLYGYDDDEETRVIIGVNNEDCATIGIVDEKLRDILALRYGPLSRREFIFADDRGQPRSILSLSSAGDPYLYFLGSDGACLMALGCARNAEIPDIRDAKHDLASLWLCDKEGKLVRYAPAKE